MTGSISESLTDDPLVIAGPKYKNVNHPSNCIIAFIYSKSSIGFLCLIGCLTTISTYLFTTQIAKSNLLCMFNDYLPVDKELHAHAKPTRYYCRMLEFSCYVLLGVSLLFGTAFLVFLSLLNYEQFIVPSVRKVLYSVVEEDSHFCHVLEPLLACKLKTDDHPDLIEKSCQRPRHHMYLAGDCVEHLTSFLGHKNWLLVLVVQYGLLLLIGIAVIMRSAYKFRQKRLRKKQPSRVIVVDNGRCADNQQIILQNGAQL
ncbi:hypothetical protein M3Y97_00973300 [Aphelenchoides bicaudatus]|nr:hypothetical protein M3Y97_00973300 [Aphelenchoides bicaudatus]